MYDWFQENDISSYFNAFINKGYDDLEVDIETITEDVLSVEFSTEIPLLGQRKKVALAVRKAKEKQGESNNTAVGDKPKASQSFFILDRQSPWRTMEKEITGLYSLSKR